jgi:predicted DNA-binding transcriptional regulator AlpA
MSDQRKPLPGLIAPLWTVQDVAAFLQVPVQTVYAWRSRGSGPPGRRVGKHLRYRPDEVLAWVESLSTDVA